jgi:hypothetical protein
VTVRRRCEQPAAAGPRRRRRPRVQDRAPALSAAPWLAAFTEHIAYRAHRRSGKLARRGSLKRIRTRLSQRDRRPRTTPLRARAGTQHAHAGSACDRNLGDARRR